MITAKPNKNFADMKGFESYSENGFLKKSLSQVIYNLN